MIKDNNFNMNAASKSDEKKEACDPKIKEMRDKEYQKRLSREHDIQIEREHGNINQASE